jgi:hypothetical protein
VDWKLRKNFGMFQLSILLKILVFFPTIFIECFQKTDALLASLLLFVSLLLQSSVLCCRPTVRVSLLLLKSLLLVSLLSLSSLLCSRTSAGSVVTTVAGIHVVVSTTVLLTSHNIAGVPALAGGPDVGGVHTLLWWRPYYWCV